MEKLKIAFASAIIISLLIASLIIFDYKNNEGVYRKFSETSVKSGEIFTLELNVKLGKDKSYYILEEDVPQGFEIVGRNFKDNKIKIIKFPNAENNLYSYQIRAPNRSGYYTFIGKYAMGKMKKSVKIKGQSIIEVNR